MKAFWILSTALLLLAPACQRKAGAGAKPVAEVADCIDPSKVNPRAPCTMEYAPVCGCDVKTYPNACAARNAGVRAYTTGPCAEPPK